MSERIHTLCFKTEVEAKEALASLQETTLTIIEWGVTENRLFFQTEKPLGPFVRSALVHGMPKVEATYWNCFAGTVKPRLLNRFTAGQWLLVSIVALVCVVLFLLDCINSGRVALLDLFLLWIGLGVIAYYSLDILVMFNPFEWKALKKRDRK